MLTLFAKNQNQDDGSHWLSISDLMAGLLMIFLFISIALMRSAFMQRDKIKQIAVAYQENQMAIYIALNKEFKYDLKKWNAEIDKKTLTVSFKSPDVLFKTGKISLSDTYKALLSDFFPRYLHVLQPFQKSIDAIWIEGHTSSDWFNTTDKEAYFKNMALSQGRTRSVLSYVYNLKSSQAAQSWIKSHIAAVGFSSSTVGFSSSRLILNASGVEDPARSRRVNFRVITNSEIQIRKILEEPS